MRRQEGVEVGFYRKSQESRGGLPGEEGEASQEGICGEFFGGGGGEIFFVGAEIPTKTGTKDPQTSTYHPSQNYYITGRYFWTINFGHRRKDYITEIVLDLFLAAAIPTGDLSDFGTASGGINFWRRNVMFTSQKLKTNYFRNSFSTDGKHPNRHLSKKKNIKKIKSGTESPLIYPIRRAADAPQRHHGLRTPRSTTE